MSIQSIEDITNIFYINLDKRTDRRELIETELEKVGLNAQRFKAIDMKKGAIGCSLSHLHLLTKAFQNNWSHICILEDDVEFLNPELFKKSLNQCLSTTTEWDVLLLGGNNKGTYTNINENCIKVNRCFTTTAYIVKGHYLQVLIENVRQGLKFALEETKKNVSNDFMFTRHTTPLVNPYAIDMHWFSLQERDNWVLLTPLTVSQRDGYSDIENKYTSYGHLMTQLNKPRLFKK